MVASTGLSLIISLGIGFEYENMSPLLDIFEKYDNHLTLLHCNNAYPTPESEINLATLNTLKSFKNVNSIGLSDHTTSTLTPSIAVALGANVIEKHFTLEKTLPGPDHAFALDPKELDEMINNIVITESMIGEQKPKYSKSELSFTKARRSIVAKCDITKGELLTVENITTKRPYLKGNLSASNWFNVLGTKSEKNYKKDDFYDFKKS